MSEQEFQQWALAVIMSVEQGREQKSQFADQVEQHDKEAAAMLRRVNEAVDALAGHLRQKFEG